MLERTAFARFVLAFLLALGLATPGWAKLNLRHIRAEYGPLGPERQSLEIVAPDEVFFTFIVAGAAVDEKGEVDAETGIVIRDADEKELFTNKSPIKGALALSGGTFGSQATVTFGPQAPPGEYTAEVTVTDKLSGESASFTRKIVLKPRVFTFTSVRLFYDKDDQVPAPAGGILNQTLFFKVRVTGHDPKAKKVAVKMEMQTLDDKGKGLMPKPAVLRIDSENNPKVASGEVIVFDGHLTLNRVGNYTLRLTFTDEVSKEESVFEMPLSVSE